MGFLATAGKILSYDESKKHQKTVKKKGVRQFLHVYNSKKNIQIPIKDLKFGHQSEYHIIRMANQNQKKRLTAFRHVHKIKEQYDSHNFQNGVAMAQEYAASMIEAIPKSPNESLDAPVISNLQNCFKKERETLTNFCRDYANDDKLLIISTATVPFIGSSYAQDFEIDPEKNQFSRSKYTTDDNISPHPRFGGLTRNIRLRRGKKVSITPPLFKDTNTNIQKLGSVIDMDCMLFGMGANSLQLTYECTTVNHARYLHDMLLPLTPLFLSLSGNSPIYRGMLADIDTRWSVISASVDSRTDEEKDPSSANYINKSRYSNMNHYISNHEYVLPKYTDTPQLNYDKELYDDLRNDGVDTTLSSHIAQLFVHDAMVIFQNAIDVDDTQNTNHFENLQSTNWNSMRFKPPPSAESDIGWRVEFRTMDLQLTDYENAALSVAVSMLVNVINHFNIDFIVPISDIDENFERAEKRGSVTDGRFLFKVYKKSCVGMQRNLEINNLHSSNFMKTSKLSSSNNDQEQKYIHTQFTAKNSKIKLLRLSEILDGYSDEQGYQFLGLFPLIQKYMQFKEYPDKERAKITQYLNYLSNRAIGIVKTGATFMREFVRNHQSYKFDSIVPQEALYDMFASEQIKDPFRDRAEQLSSSDENLSTASNASTQANSPIKKPCCNEFCKDILKHFDPTRNFQNMNNCEACDEFKKSGGLQIFGIDSSIICRQASQLFEFEYC